MTNVWKDLQVYTGGLCDIIFHLKNFVNFCKEDYENLINYNFPIISIYNDLYNNTTLQNTLQKEYEILNFFNCYIFGKGSGMPIDLQFNFYNTSINGKDYIICENDDESLQPHPYRRILLCEIINNYNENNEIIKNNENTIKKIPILENLMNFNCDEDNLYYFYEYYKMIFILIGEFNLLQQFENIYKNLKDKNMIKDILNNNDDENNELWRFIIYNVEDFQMYELDFYGQFDTKYFGMLKYNYLFEYFHYNTSHRSIHSILRKKEDCSSSLQSIVKQ
ncbi:hypothetical protein ABK040_012272 [Willaertia magna]